MTPVEFPSWTLIPFALSALLFGLPHGALDHLVAAKMFCRSTPSVACWCWIFVGYLAAAGLGWLVWHAHPALGFVAFIALTCYHWGQGELEVASRWHPEWLGSRLHRTTFLVWRGMQPMLLPLVMNATTYASVAAACLGLFGDRNPSLPHAVQSGGPFAIAACAMAWGVEKILAPPATRWAPKKLLLETSFTALFLCVHPIFGIGLYFLFWHALHHMNRLRYFFARPNHLLWPLSWPRLMWLALPLTLFTLAILVVIGVITANLTTSSKEWLPVYLVALACLTWPHAALVTMQDAREHIWKASAARGGTL